MIAYSWASFGNDLMVAIAILLVVALFWLAHLLTGTDEQVKK